MASVVSLQIVFILVVISRLLFDGKDTKTFPNLQSFCHKKEQKVYSEQTEGLVGVNSPFTRSKLQDEKGQVALPLPAPI